VTLLSIEATSCELAGAVLRDLDLEHFLGLVPIIDDIADVPVLRDHVGEFLRQ
jgi:hypothetical protein